LHLLAHRISTIIDADRLIVLADGKIVELDTPWNLLNKSDSPGAVFKVSLVRFPFLRKPIALELKLSISYRIWQSAVDTSLTSMKLLVLRASE
jgi:hypothetical protein